MRLDLWAAWGRLGLMPCLGTLWHPVACCGLLWPLRLCCLHWYNLAT